MEDPDWALKKAIEIACKYKVIPVTKTAPLEDEIAEALREAAARGSTKE